MLGAVFYLSQRFLFGITDFLNHWYVRSFFNMSHFMIGVFERLDRIFALKINLKYWLKPLYQDSGILGHVLGFFARSVRIFLATVVYIPVFLLSALAYFVWLTIPILIVYQIFINYGKV